MCIQRYTVFENVKSFEISNLNHQSDANFTFLFLKKQKTHQCFFDCWLNIFWSKYFENFWTEV